MMNYDQIFPSGGSTGAPLNLRKRVARLQKAVPLDGKRILDCGCGPGLYLIDFLKTGNDAYGIELDEKKVTEFQEKYPLYKTRIRRGDLEDIPYAENSFDLTFFNEVLEHVPNDRKALIESFRVLKPGGFLAIFSPNRLYPFESHTVMLRATRKNLPIYIPFIPYIPLVIGKKIFVYWARNYWPSELKNIIKTIGFKIVETDFVWQTFENISNIQPKGISQVKPILRKLSSLLEKTPILRSFGISRFILARKPDDMAG